jgi:nucleolar GTP-binding protein
VTLSAPTVVFVGAPNVGKSTMVTELSTGEPEIGNYAFTTRAVTLGHVYEDGKKMGQVMDTPGLLDREDDERNEMEELTLATMRHLPCVRLLASKRERL